MIVGARRLDGRWELPGIAKPDEEPGLWLYPNGRAVVMLARVRGKIICDYPEVREQAEQSVRGQPAARHSILSKLPNDEVDERRGCQLAQVEVSDAWPETG